MRLAVTALVLTAGLSAAVFSTQHRLGFRHGDDWEPAMALDRFGHLYSLYLHFPVAGQDPCPACDNHLVIQRSSDGGATWTAPLPIAPGPVHNGQFDPWMVVDPADGKTVWISFMENFPNAQIVAVKSMDFGQTWSAPRAISGRPPHLDKDVLAVRGNTMAVCFDDYLNRWSSVSHDGGATWTPHMIAAGKKYFQQMLCSGAGIDSQGTIYFAWNRYDKNPKPNDAPAKVWIERSSDGGESWAEIDIDSSGAPPACDHCGAGAYLAAQIALRVANDDTVYALWNATPSLVNGGPERIFFAKSTDHGATFTPRREVSSAPAGVEHCFPSLITGEAAGDVRVAWMDTRTGPWNVFYRASADGGDTFGETARVSSYVPGYPYLTAQGFLFPYGDYFQMAIDEHGKTHIVFGETTKYTDPGNIWAANEE